MSGVDADLATLREMGMTFGEALALERVGAELSRLREDLETAQYMRDLMFKSVGTVSLALDDKGFSEETCLRCGWRMGQPALNCQNDDTPHRFPSQDTPADSQPEETT